MKVNIETLQDTFKISMEAFEESRNEALKVIDMYHNRQYTDMQEATLENRGQPKETFNIIKLFTRMLIGYYSTVVNTVRVVPTSKDDILTAAIVGDLVDHVFEVNDFHNEGDKLKLDMLLTGLMSCYVDVVETKDKDEFGRHKYKIEINHVPSTEILLDPMSRLDNYNDARYIHRFKWVSEDELNKLFGANATNLLNAYSNHTNIDGGDFEDTYNTRFNGKYKVYDNYLLIHTIMIDDDDKSWSVFWCDDKILDKKEITYKKVKNPYRIHKLHTSNKTEFYGLFREIIETQHAINQALIKIQLMVNTQKAFVEDGAVDSLENFTDQFYRVNAVIPVKDLQGIRIENLSREVLDQYMIIDKALDRIQRILSINDSFLGMAYASDSGAKVRLQQGASVVALRYVTAKVEQFYRLLGYDIVNLLKQYFTYHDVIRITDSDLGYRWLEINKPIQRPTGNINQETMEPEMQYVYEEVIDPANGEYMEDEEGNIIMAPIPTMDSEIAFTEADIKVESVSYNDEDERNQAVLEQFINGPIGNILSSINPVGYFKAAGLAVRNLKSRYSIELSQILEDTANMMGGDPNAMGAMQQGQVPGQMPQNQAINQRPNRPQIGGE